MKPWRNFYLTKRNGCVRSDEEEEVLRWGKSPSNKKVYNRKYLPNPDDVNCPSFKWFSLHKRVEQRARDQFNKIVENAWPGWGEKEKARGGGGGGGGGAGGGGSKRPYAVALETELKKQWDKASTADKAEIYQVIQEFVSEYAQEYKQMCVVSGKGLLRRPNNEAGH